MIGPGDAGVAGAGIVVGLPGVGRGPGVGACKVLGLPGVGRGLGTGWIEGLPGFGAPDRVDDRDRVAAVEGSTVGDIRDGRLSRADIDIDRRSFYAVDVRGLVRASCSVQWSLGLCRECCR